MKRTVLLNKYYEDEYYVIHYTNDNEEQHELSVLLNLLNDFVNISDSNSVSIINILKDMFVGNTVAYTCLLINIVIFIIILLSNQNVVPLEEEKIKKTI